MGGGFHELQQGSHGDRERALKLQAWGLPCADGMEGLQ